MRGRGEQTREEWGNGRERQKEEKTEKKERVERV